MQGFYLPWYMLGIDLILGNPLKPDMLGIAAGHAYYFLTVLYPLASGKNYFKTPRWVYPFHNIYFILISQHATISYIKTDNFFLDLGNINSSKPFTTFSLLQLLHMPLLNTRSFESIEL